jgi:hypothetical protein
MQPFASAALEAIANAHASATLMKIVFIANYLHTALS